MQICKHTPNKTRFYELQGISQTYEKYTSLPILIKPHLFAKGCKWHSTHYTPHHPNSLLWLLFQKQILFMYRCVHSFSPVCFDTYTEPYQAVPCNMCCDIAGMISLTR